MDKASVTSYKVQKTERKDFFVSSEHIITKIIINVNSSALFLGSLGAHKGPLMQKASKWKVYSNQD